VELKVNDSKFAPVTSALIARKGFAAPSVLAAPKTAALWEQETFALQSRSELTDMPRLVVNAGKAAQPTVASAAPAAPVVKAASPARDPQPAEAGAAAPVAAAPDAPKPRRIMVMVPAGDVERLAIAAIKKGKTRHEIVKEALDAYFQRLAFEFSEPCQCMLQESQASLTS
jgi:hypothetical protein